MKTGIIIGLDLLVLLEVLDPLADVLLLQVACSYNIRGVSRGCSTQVQVVCPIVNHHGNQRGRH